VGAIQAVPGSDLQGLVLRYDEERDEDVVLDGGVRGAEQDATTTGAAARMRLLGRGLLVPVPLGSGRH